MALWNVVTFLKDDRIVTVPNIWFKNNKCAWPKDLKLIKTFIKQRKIPNENDFFFYPARKLKEKNYTTLPEARSKSYLFKRKIKHKHSRRKCSSAPANLNRHEQDTFSPQYNSTVLVKSTLQVNSSVGSGNKAGRGPLWKIKSGDIIEEDNDSHEISNIEYCSVEKNVSSVSKIYSSNGNFELSSVNNINSREQIQFVNSVGNWSVQEEDKGSTFYKKSADDNNLLTNSVLFHEDNQNENTDYTSNSVEPTFGLENNGSNCNYNTQPKETESFQTFVTNSLIHLKYEMGLLTNMVQSAVVNNDISINNSNKNFNSSSVSSNSVFGVGNLFPLKSISELDGLEEQLKIHDFRTLVINKLSILVDNDDLGHSVRRIIGYMFNDDLLSHYSLLGFKKKHPFSNLLSYGVIIDCIKTSPSYNSTPLKEINKPLSIWLAQATHRNKKREAKKILENLN